MRIMWLATIRRRAPIVYTGDLEHGFTSERLSQVFGLDLKVTHANGRWNAYAV